MEALRHRHHLEGQLADAQDAAERSRAEAALLAGKGQDASDLERAALEADEHVRTLETALARARTADDIRAGLVARLEHNLRAEADKIRAEVVARQGQARQWLALAVSGQEVPEEAKGQNLLLLVALADADAALVQQATPAQRSVFGSAVGWLDNQIAGMVPGHLRPRSPLENNRAPVPSRTY
jgi:hypothetical protein